MNIRKIALGLLYEYEMAGKYVNLSLSSHATDRISSEERAILTSLLYTTVEHKLTYDYYISSLSSRAVSEIDPYTQNILRLGLCQIIDINSVPDFAAVNETVKLARNPGERVFVNGVLRAAVRKKDSLPLPPPEKNYKRYLSVKYSFPLWIVKLLSRHYGDEACERMLEYFNTAKYTDLTVNTLKVSADSFADGLIASGYNVKRHSEDCSVRILSSVNPEKLAGFDKGDFFVQDRASLISAYALSAKPTDTVIDVCACPGGKSFANAVLMGDTGKIYSFDLHESKLSLITDGARRLGLRSVKAEMHDATTAKDELIGCADKVICDVPCSGLGVLGKKPDLRYKSEEAALALPELQLNILKESAKYLRVDGEMIYSTCTLNPAENEEVVEKFLEENKSFAPLPFEVGNISAKSGMLTLLPHVHNTDGFFMAKLKRTK